jgi:transposase-like protein
MKVKPPRARPEAPPLQEQVRGAISGGLDELSTRELLALALNSLFRAERDTYLDSAAEDKGNGSYDRTVNVGSLPLEVEVPRSRKGHFRPSLPPPYQRGYADAARNLLLRLAASGRSLGAAREALRGLGLPVPDEQFDAVSRHFVEEFDLRNTRPLDTDLLALFIDAKYVEVRETDHLRPCCLYVAVGLLREGKKRVLACHVLPGRESIENWKSFLRSLLERGLRNVLIVVQHDFPGLLNVNKGLFPTADIQLCVVHMQRNAKSHLGKAGAAEFNARMRTIKTAWNPELAGAQFDDLCQAFENSSPAFIAELRKKRDHYLQFLRYPETLRRTFSTTNPVEAVNGQLEIMRRNNGGYFHGTDNLKAKLAMTLNRLENLRWRRVAVPVLSALAQLEAMFLARFESES